MDQLPRLGKRELICLLLFTCNYVVSVWRGFLFLWVLGMGYVILLWHSLSLPYNYLLYKSGMQWGINYMDMLHNDIVFAFNKVFFFQHSPFYFCGEPSAQIKEDLQIVTKSNKLTCKPCIGIDQPSNSACLISLRFVFIE